jgi:1,4-dihydroxy-2-naphthoyl-CoA hydrolase
MTENLDILSTLQERLPPFSRLLGIQFTSVAPERMIAEMLVRDVLCTTPAILHGGAVMAFADTLGAFATVVNLKDGYSTTTVESKTNFFAPAPLGTKIIGECTALHRGKRTMAWQTRITNENGRLIAIVTQTQMVLEPKVNVPECNAVDPAESGA